jgi:hypothetical protein
MHRKAMGDGENRGTEEQRNRGTEGQRDRGTEQQATSNKQQGKIAGDRNRLQGDGEGQVKLRGEMAGDGV